MTSIISYLMSILVVVLTEVATIVGEVSVAVLVISRVGVVVVYEVSVSTVTSIWTDVDTKVVDVVRASSLKLNVCVVCVV